MKSATSKIKPIWIVPIALATVVSTMTSAEAASLCGEFNLNGVISTVTLAKNSLTFSPDPAPVVLGLQTGDFLPFQSAAIGDIFSFYTLFDAEDPFLDFSTSPYPGGAGIIDGVDIFSLSYAEYDILDSGTGNVMIDVALKGTFFINGMTTPGAGNVTFQVNNTTSAQVYDLLDAGGTVQALFSGAAFTVKGVPESSAVLSFLGLGLMGAVGVVRKRR